jgi:hypothetical protein
MAEPTTVDLAPEAAVFLPEPAGLSTDPIYVYAVTGGAAESWSGALPSGGIDPQRPVELLPVRFGGGEELPGELLAVISSVRAELFNEDAVRRGLDDRIWLAAYVLAHQQVLDALVATGQGVIPMRFCTIYPDAVALSASLARHGAALAAELARQHGKQEWGVKQVVDIQALQAAIGSGHPALADVAADAEIERLRKQIAGMSAGAAFLLKKKLTNLVAERAQAIAFGVADATLRALCSAALDVVTSDLPKDRPEVCLNASFWVETARYGEFVAQLEQLAGTFGSVGVRYELSGPWPPHHFLQLSFELE